MSKAKWSELLGMRRDEDNSARQDNTRPKDIRPMEAPEFTEEQKRDLDTVTDGKSTGKYKFDSHDAAIKTIHRLAGRDDTMTDVYGEYEMPNGSKREVKEGEMRGDKLLQKSNDKRKGKESGIYDDELKKTAKRVDPR